MIQELKSTFQDFGAVAKQVGDAIKTNDTKISDAVAKNDSAKREMSSVLRSATSELRKILSTIS